MSDREQLELLVSRHLDGDLSGSEQARLTEALAQDAGLRELHAELERVHNSVSLLAEERLPADFTNKIRHALPDNAPVLRLPARGWHHWAAAAAAVLVVGALLTALVTNTGTPGDYTPIADTDPEHGVVAPPDATYTGPRASVLVYSEGELELAAPNHNSRTRRFQGELHLPAEISAPADTHAVVEVGGGTAVLSPGSRARLADVDADGMPDLEPVDGDVYMESSNGFGGRVGDVRMALRGGATLRRTANGYRVLPSHGGMYVGEMPLRYRQCADIGLGGVVIEACEFDALDDWAVRGRADAIKEQLRRIHGERFDSIPADHWQKFDLLLRGVLSRPWERATYAYMLRFLLKYEFIEQATPAQLEAWEAIADILAEGTTESDIPVSVLDVIGRVEERFEEDPQALQQFKQMLRESIEAIAKRD